MSFYAPKPYTLCFDDGRLEFEFSPKECNRMQVIAKCHFIRHAMPSTCIMLKATEVNLLFELHSFLEEIFTEHSVFYLDKIKNAQQFLAGKNIEIFVRDEQDVQFIEQSGDLFLSNLYSFFQAMDFKNSLNVCLARFSLETKIGNNENTKQVDNFKI